jgi:hypothetical protein
MIAEMQTMMSLKLWERNLWNEYMLVIPYAAVENILWVKIKA